MSLRHRERQRLNVIARQLEISDPQLARLLTGAGTRPRLDLVRVAGIGLALGVLALVSGLGSQLAPLCAAGWLLIFASGIVWAFWAAGDVGE